MKYLRITLFALIVILSGCQTNNNKITQEFKLFKRQIDYENTDLNDTITKIEVSSNEWTVEKIEFNAAYGDERMMVYLYLPTTAGTPPFQTVIWFPGGYAMRDKQFEPEKYSEIRHFDFIIKSGRAVLFPIYIGTYGRIYKHVSDFDDGIKIRFIKLSQDLHRSLDYLETREDIDRDKLTLYGYSWGASYGGMMGAFEPRLKCLILKNGGLYLQPNDSIDSPFFVLASFQSLFFPQVRQPVLMLNGEHDIHFPLQSSQLPMYEMLGTDSGDKQHKVYNSGHWIPRDDLIKEVVEWLDTYLGEIDQ